jgi:long-chain fatty acid transport protein
MMTSAALAGGFARGTADTDILYEDGNFDMRVSATIVVPTRKLTLSANPANLGADYANTYIIPSGAIKFKFSDNLGCAGTVVNAYGGSATYPFPTASGKLDERFDIYELGATCAASFQAGPGKIYVLGGLFYEVFDYSLFSATTTAGRFLDVGLTSSDIGWRAGIGYDYPEIALRAQLMYRSGTEHIADGSGALQIPAVGATIPLGPAFGDGELPQSVELKLQSGVAPGWLVFGSVKWTDWSVLDTLNLSVPGAGVNTANRYFWKDGWTITAGVGHAFTETISGAVSLTWDQGVGTGWDLSSDTWTLAAGASMKEGIGELRAGVGLSYLTSATETQYGPANSAVGSDWAIAFSGSYKVKF